MCLEKSGGGLDVRDINNCNLTLLCKWLWWWVLGEKSLWIDIVKSEYRSFRDELVSGLSSKCWSLWWKNLYEIWLGGLGCLFRSNIDFLLGDGRVFGFWSGPWLSGLGSLKSQFPSLYRLSAQKGACVCEVFSWSKNYWLFKWERFFTTNELLEFVDL